ncbi:18038_t:CDS:2, partial [Cetraspora pellucida]
MSIRSCLAAIWWHLNTCSVMKKPVDILNSKVYFDLNQVINKKLKTLSVIRLGKKNRADGLMLNEVDQILEHSIMQRNTPEGLLQQVFFYNAILLALHRGEHYSFQINSFVKQFDEDDICENEVASENVVPENVASKNVALKKHNNTKSHNQK